MTIETAKKIINKRGQGEEWSSGLRGVIHSEEEKGVQSVTISRFGSESGEYIAKVNDKLCTAIYNVFVGLWYVDDIYGVIIE